MRVRKLEKRPWRTETMILRMTPMLPSIPLEKRGFLRRMGFMEGTGRSRSNDRDKPVRAALPTFIEPALATLVDQAPAGDGWIHEIKLDGYRTAARLDSGKVRVLTRGGLDWAVRFPPIAAVRTMP
jgi:ATP-dependent DNA ligase